MRTKKNLKKMRMTKMNSEISIENRKAMSIPQKGAVFNSAILLESQCTKESNDIVSYHFLFKRTAKRPDLLTVLNNFSKGTRINLEDGDYLIKSHDYTIKSLKKGIKVTGSFSTVPVSLSNPHVKQMTALEDFDHEYSKMEMTQPETYFRVYPYQNFNGPAFRAKLFSYVSTMGENYGYCDDKSLYYRRASLVMPKIKITKAIPQAKMMFHTHPKKDEPSISSPDDYLLYFDLSHKPRNIRHFYTVMADRMDYFHITPKHDKKNDYVKIDEDKFIEKLDKKMDEIAKKLDEKLPSKTAADDLYYCEKITKEVVKWLNKEYSKYFKIKYKCHYRVKRNPDKDMGEDLHLGDAFLAKALNDIKSGSYTWPEFDENSLPHEKYAFWYSLYYAMNMDRNGAGYSRVLRLQPGDIRRLHYFGNKRFEGTQFDYYDIINILLLNYDISMADAKVRDGTGTTSRIEEILDFLEVEEEIPRDNLILLTQVLEQGIHSDEARTTAGDHYFILPLIEACVLGLQSIEDVKAGANYELKKHELMVHSEKAGNATAQALGDLYNKTFPSGTSKSLRPNPSLKRQRVQYNGKLPKHSMANVELIQDLLKEFAPSRLDIPKDYETERGDLSLRVKVEEEIVTIKLTPSTGNLQIFSYSDEAAIGAVRKVIEVMKPYIDFTTEDDIDNIGVITNEPVRNPKNAIIISVASPIQKTKNEVLTSLEKRLRDSTIATTYTTRTLREYEKRPHIVEVSDDMYNRLVSNGDIIMGISYGDSERRGYKRSDFEKSKYVLVDTMIRDQDLLSRANSSIISFYLHPTNSKGNVEYYLKNHVSPQEAKKVASLLDYLKDMASGDTFDHVIEYDINKPSFVIEEVFKEVPKSNPKGPDPLEQTIFGDGSSYLTAQTIPITALQNLRTGTSAATTAGPPLLNPKQPSVITISGPSGVGKTTIIKRISKMTGAEFVPSVTTRPLRPKEKEGVDKFVVTKERFEQMIANGEFVEHRKLKNGHYYGRRYSDFKDLSIVDVTLKGKNEFKKKFPNTFSIFLKPNVSADVLASHMRKRGGMSESERKGRADIIERMLESASKMDFDLVITSRVGEYEKVAEEIVPQLPQPNPKKYKGKASVVISRSTKKDKKLMAVFNFPDGRKKTTHFGGKGYSDYTIHNDKDRKKRYDTRHSSREDWDDFTTAGALSKWILWNKPSLMDSFNHYKAMFSLDGAITVQTSQAGKIPASRNPPEEVFIENYLNPDRREKIIKRLNRRLKNISGSKIKSRKDKLKEWREAYNWKGRNAESLLEAILSTIDKEIGNKSVFKIYRAMITLQFSEADFLNNMQTVPVGSSWTTYKEGADIYVGGSKFDYLGMRPGKQALLTATAHISAVDVYNTVGNRLSFPQEKELTMYDDVKINRVDFYPIDDKARDKFLSWRTTGKNWKPWIDPSIKPETVYKYQGQYVETYESNVLEPTYITNPRADRTDTYLFDSNPRIPKKTKRNPSHCPIEVEARRAATDKSFKHHKWYVKHHLDYVMAIMKRMPKVMGNWDKEMVDMVWMHDYPKMVGGGHDLAIVNTLLTKHRGEDYAHKVVHQLHLMERLKKSDWNSLTEYSMVAANLSTADALAHYYGPFFQLYIDENPDMSMDEIKKSNRQKLAKDKLKLRAGPMKDGLDSIRFQYKGRKVRILGNEQIKELIEKKNPMAPGYQSYSWTTEDWRSIKVNNKGEIDYKEKCGAEGTQTPDGSPRLCLPAEVIRSLLRTESGKDVIRTQARKKARAKKGERVPWHPRIKKIWKRVKEQSPKDKKNPGWRHGEQMEDDPFAEYFEENVEGDENTTTV